MNWAAALYAAGIWMLAASGWTSIRRPAHRRSNARAAFQAGRELVLGLLLGLLFGLVG